MFTCFVISVFCKVTAATFPLVVVLLDWFMGRRITGKRLLSYLPLVIVSVIFIRIGISASGAFGHITDLGQKYSLIDRVFILFHALWLYLVKAILPMNQSVIYLYPWKEGVSLPSVYFFTGILALIVSATILFTGWKLRKKESGKIILFGFLFFLLTICIVLPLKWSRTVLIAERYTYIPYIGLVTGILALLFNFAGNAGRSSRIILWITLTGIALLFAVITFNRTSIWKDPVSLFTDVIAKNRSGAEVSMGYYNRGNEYFRLNDTTHAFSDYSEAIRIFPGYTDAFFNRGLVNYEKRDYNAAADDFSRAIALKEDFTQAYLNRGTVYRALGKIALALVDFNKAIEIKPGGMAYFSRGVLFFFNLKEPRQACEDWTEAAALGYEPAQELLEKYCR